MIVSEEKVRNTVAAMNEGNVPQDAVVKAACQRVGSMIKPELTGEELVKYSDNILYAAAVMALRDSLAADASPTDIKAGDISIKNPQRVEALTGILQEILKFLGPIVETKDELFFAAEWEGRPCMT